MALIRTRQLYLRNPCARARCPSFALESNACKLGYNPVITANMTPFTCFATILTFGALSLSFYNFQPAPEQQTGPKFSELSRDDIARLDRQRALVAAAAKQRFGISELLRTKVDLPVLQRLIDDQAFTKTQTYELQSLGVAFGDVLSSELPLRWVIVTDEFGTDPTLRFKNTTIQVNALTMISKRIEKDERVNLSRLLQITREQLASVKKEPEK
jgi:hypothetical protein